MLPVDFSKPEMVFKKKFRWTFEAEFPCGYRLPLVFVKLQQRPILNIEEKEINYLGNKSWIPGKSRWESITTIICDMNEKADGANDWLNSFFGFLGRCFAYVQDQTRDKDREVVWPTDLIGEGTLTMYDGCGTKMEMWLLKGLTIESLDFDELSYSSEPYFDLGITWKYKEVCYQSGGFQ